MMKILHIVPEFEEGGVERYVLNLSREQIKRGHEITLATAGGKLEKYLHENIKLIKIPAQKKNPFTIIFCALYLSLKNKNFKWDIVHAHSRVPAWIAWLISGITKIKWIMTAHAPYSLNPGIIPFKHADGAICVSESVEKHLEKFLPKLKITIPNGVKKPEFLWQGKGFLESKNPKFLYVGYLARRKGLDVAINALGFFKNKKWTLDVVGDGAQREELENLVEKLNLKDRVKFYGFRDDAEKFMSESDCLLFPSHQEGLPLTVNEALAVGLPVLASDIEPLRPLSKGKLIEPGNVEAWKEAIKILFESGKASPLSAENLTSFDETVDKNEKFYERVLNKK